MRPSKESSNGPPESIAKGREPRTVSSIGGPPNQEFAFTLTHLPNLKLRVPCATLPRDLRFQSYNIRTAICPFPHTVCRPTPVHAAAASHGKYRPTGPSYTKRPTTPPSA